MNIRRIVALATAAGGLASLGAAPPPVIGPDVIVGNIHGTTNWTPGPTLGIIRAYSVGTTACNIGDVPVPWIEETNDHPVITQNMYRLQNGRFEQIGQAWAKHAFCAEQGHYCQTCTDPDHDCTALAVGCSDPYTASRNGTQGYLGPKSEINASTGYFPYPVNNNGNCGTTPICKRLQVAASDLTSDATALYFVSSMYVQPEDAQAHNNNNNESYRQVLVGNLPDLDLTLTATTQETEPGILAWADNDPGVMVSNVDVPNDGRFIIASRATLLPTGGYHYEYAVMNLNSDRSARSFTVPLGAGASASSLGFHDVPYHSGEPYDGTDWTVLASTTSSVTWFTQTFAQNQNANALRWDTIYTFRFDSSAAPVTGTVTLGLFKPSTSAPNTVSSAAVVPGP